MQDFDSIFKEHRAIYLHGKTKSGKTTSILDYVNNNHKEYRYIKIQDLKNEQDFFHLLKTQNIYSFFCQTASIYRNSRTAPPSKAANAS